MKNAKMKKRALLTSLLALFLCCTMLVGTTFAWFTDSVESGINKIVAGNLDVEVYDDKDLTDDDKGTKITETYELFEDTLWEPGKVVYKNVRVANEGTLALKYRLMMDVAGENSVIEEDGTTTNYKLSDVVKIAYVEDGIKGLTGVEEDDRKAVLDIVGNDFGYIYNTEITGTVYPEDGKDEVVYGIVLYWAPDEDGATDNNYNVNNGKKTTPLYDEENKLVANSEEQLMIRLGLSLMATQVEHELDSFGPNYDEKAPASVWDGAVLTEMPETLVVDGATQTIHVKDAAAFAYLSTLSAKWAGLYTDGKGTTYTNYVNGAGGNYYYSGQWTISLEADIDLDNRMIEPVEIAIGQSTGATAFNGNNHVISNINTTTGLFANGTRASFSNLTLENVTASNGALSGSVNHVVNNVTVKNATISGADYVGGLVGKTYSSVNGCKVIDSSVTATGKEAGGLIGYAETNSKGSIITNNYVRNVTVYAGNRAAGLVAQPNVNIKVYNNVIDSVIIGANDVTQYQAGAVVSNALAPENVYDNTVTNANVAAKAAIATDNTSFGTAITDGSNVVFLDAGDYIIPTAAKGKTLTIVGSGEDTNVTVTKVGTGGENCDYGLDGSTVVFENITITTNSSTYIGYARCSATYNNCTINGTYTLYGDSVFNDCTFNVSGDVYNIWTWGAPNATFNNCTFNSDGKALLLYGTENTNLTVNGCVFNDNGGLTDKKAAIEIGNDYGKSYTLTVNNTTVNGYEINDKGINTGTTLWANKDSMSTDKLDVVVNGVEVY